MTRRGDESIDRARPPGADVVRGHYDAWPFPGTEHRSREGPQLVRLLATWLEEREGARVLDAGCGTGETVFALARRFPHATFVGADAAEIPLERAAATAEALAVPNVTFRHLDLDLPRGAACLEPPFDVALALGVLHHTSDVGRSFARLVEATRPGGRVVVWLYGRHGRHAHRLNQELIRLLARGDPDDAPATAAAFLRALGATRAAGTGFYTPHGDGSDGLAWLLEHPSWLADQMFPPVEHAVTLPEVLDLFDRERVAFTHWLGVSTDPARHTRDGALLSRFARLPERDRLRALDLLLRPPYYFVAGRREGGAPPC